MIIYIHIYQYNNNDNDNNRNAAKYAIIIKNNIMDILWKLGTKRPNFNAK